MRLQSLILFFLLAIHGLKAQQCSSYALQWDNSLSTEFLVSIDRTTGAVTQVDSIPGVQSIAIGLSAFDSQDGLYIFQSGSGNLYSIDANSGSTVSNPVLSASVNELEYDNVTGNLYGLHWDNALSEEFFVSVDRTSGTITKIASIPGVQSTILGLSAFDSQNGLYIFGSGSGNLFSVDANTGAVVFSPALSASINELNYDHTTGNLYALHWDNTLSKEFFVSVDRTTGTVTKIDSIPGVQTITLGVSTFDSENGLYIFQSGSGELYSIDAITGATVSNPILSSSINELQHPNLKTEPVYISDASVCENDSSMLSVPSGYSDYLWSNGATTNTIYISDSSAYTVTVTSNYGCQGTSTTASVNIFDCSMLIDSLTAGADTCLLDSLSITMAYIGNISIVNDTVYLTWNFITSSSDTLLINANYFFNQNGTYSVGLAVTCGGRAQTETYYDLIEVTHMTNTATQNLQPSRNFTIYPNPADNHVIIKHRYWGDQMQVEVISVHGQQVMKKTLTGPEELLDTSTLESGIYFMRIRTKNESQIIKLVKK